MAPGTTSRPYGKVDGLNYMNTLVQYNREIHIYSSTIVETENVQHENRVKQ
jgi:hypothetical protein